MSDTLPTWNPAEYLEIVRESALNPQQGGGSIYGNGRDPEILVPATESEANELLVPLPADSEHPFRIVELSMIPVTLFLHATGPTDQVPLYVAVDEPSCRHTLNVRGGRVIVLLESGSMYLNAWDDSDVAVVIGKDGTLLLTVYDEEANVAVFNQGDLRVEHGSHERFTYMDSGRA